MKSTLITLIAIGLALGIAFSIIKATGRGCTENCYAENAASSS